MRILKLEEQKLSEMLSTADVYLICVVKFPGNNQEYTLYLSQLGLLCKNPDKTEQNYCIEGFNCE